jgi:TrmH family RNA methyltransferase
MAEYHDMTKSEKPPLKPLKWYKKLATAKGRLQSGAFIAEGDKAISQIHSVQPDAIIEVLTPSELPPVYTNYTIRYVTDKQFNSICQTKTPQGQLAVVKLPIETYSDQLPENVGDKVLLLEDIQDPGNVGTIIRTAAAFGFSGAILTPNCADPFSPKCVQATAGTILSLWLRETHRYIELAEALKESGHFLVATELKGSSDTSVFFERDSLLLALGNEASGISRQLLDISDYRFRIPVASEKAESLNVAACGAICMYLSSLK